MFGINVFTLNVIIVQYLFEINLYDRITVEKTCILLLFALEKKTNVDSTIYFLQNEMQALVKENASQESVGTNDAKHHPLLLQVMS
jgi:hypothetical protein